MATDSTNNMKMRFFKYHFHLHLIDVCLLLGKKKCWSFRPVSPFIQHWNDVERKTSHGAVLVQFQEET